MRVARLIAGTDALPPPSDVPGVGRPWLSAGPSSARMLMETLAPPVYPLGPTTTYAPVMVGSASDPNTTSSPNSLLSCRTLPFSPCHYRKRPCLPSLRPPSLRASSRTNTASAFELLSCCFLYADPPQPVFFITRKLAKNDPRKQNPKTSPTQLASNLGSVLIKMRPQKQAANRQRTDERIKRTPSPSVAQSHEHSPSPIKTLAPQPSMESRLQPVRKA